MKRLSNWQVFFGLLGFTLLMGFMGALEESSQVPAPTYREARVQL